MAAGAFVLATKYSGDAPELIELCDNGVVLDDVQVSDTEVEKIDAAIRNYKNDYSKRSSFAIANILKYRSWSINEDKLTELYRKLFS